MAVSRCPQCSIPCLDTEFEQGVCPGCGAPLRPSPEPTRGDIPVSTPTIPVPRRAAPFLLGLFAGCLIGGTALWVTRWQGAPLPGGGDQTAALEAMPPPKTEAVNRVGEAEAAHQAAEAAHAESRKALSAANRQAATLLKQKEEAEHGLHDALALLAAERGFRAALEKTLSEERKPEAAPERSFLRDWQLLGPFASTGEQSHDAVFPPEREPFRPEKTYDSVGGRVKWRPYHSAEDKIDLAAFFQYREAGAAYAVSWAFADEDRDVTLGIGSDDGVRIWVNGAQVHDIKGGRQARAGQDIVKTRLRKGWNEIRAKVDNIVGTWELYLEFRTADGREPLKVFSTNLPPAAAR